MSDELAVTPYYDEQDRDYILEFAVNAADSSYVTDAWEDNQKLRAKLSKRNMRARKKNERGAATEKVLLRVGNVGIAIIGAGDSAQLLLSRIRLNIQLSASL